MRVSVVSLARSNCEAAISEYDVFADISQSGMSTEECENYVSALDADCGLVVHSRLLTVVVPRDVTVSSPCATIRVVKADGSSPAKSFGASARRAGSEHRHLLVVTAPILPGNEVVRRLVDELETDPMFGTVQPRFADSLSDDIWGLPTDPEQPHSGLRFPRARLVLLPRLSITPEFLSACTVIRSQVATEIECIGSQWLFEEICSALNHARRRGFRNVIANHVAIKSQLSPTDLYPAIPANTIRHSDDACPDAAQARHWLRNLSQIPLERVVSGLYSSTHPTRPRMLLDCRGMSAQHNGTSHAMIGMLKGFQELQAPWEIDVLANAEAKEFFRLEQQYPEWNIMSDLPSHTYGVAVMLNQPWWITRMYELHRHALVVLYSMLDTIAWDVIYACDPRLDEVWKFMSRYADGLLYISEFSQKRFQTRFHPADSVAECVTYLSLSADDYVDPAIQPDYSQSQILIFGNDYDHKDVHRTVRLLADAFPYRQMVAVGIKCDGLGNVVGMPSGQIEHSVLHSLIASASVIVMPSFYEGFGLPVVQGLAYGRPVVVRDSELWRELAQIMNMPGTLVVYRDSVSLVESVGRILRRERVDNLHQGSSLGCKHQPISWVDCARRASELALSLLVSANAKVWIERENAFRFIREMKF